MDRSTVSRWLSGRMLPPLGHLLRMAAHLDVDPVMLRRRWQVAAEVMRDPHVRREAYLAGGAPPARLVSHADLMRALRHLLRAQGISERKLERRDPQLRRSTVGAVLRGDRGAPLEVVTGSSGSAVSRARLPGPGRTPGRG